MHPSERSGTNQSFSVTKLGPFDHYRTAQAGVMHSCESNLQGCAVMSLISTDRGLLTPENCAVIFVDHQPQLFFGVAN
jgi:hypothetical protein